jgi:DNA-binding transcriptional LysR family regulator
MDLNLLPLFLAVAETSSFSEAARRLSLPKSSVSRGVAALEAELGAQLFHRTTRHVGLTAAGQALYERASPPLASLREALGSLPDEEEQPAGELRLTAPTDLGATFLAELVARFTARYPAIRVDARLSQATLDLVAEGIDLALRASSRPLADSSLVARRLSAIEFQLFASPTYLARRGAPRGLEDAAGHDWVLQRSSRLREQLRLPAGGARVVGDDLLFLREVVRAGAGIGLLPSFLVKEQLAQGELVHVLPRHTERTGTLYLVYPKGQHLPRKVTAFRDFLVDFLTARPLAPAGGE